MVDGNTLTDQPYLALRMGAFNHTPMLMGVAGDEEGFFLAVAQEKVGYAALTRDGYLAYAKANSGAHLDEVLKIYPPGGMASPSLDEMAVGQSIRGCAMRMLAGWLAPWEPTWTYSFDDRTVPNYLKPQPYPLGAYHTAEILYLFPNFHGGLGAPHPLNAAQEALSDRMIATWATFAKTGNPNPAGSKAWPVYDAKRDNVQSLDIPGFRTTEGYGKRYSCATFDKITGL